METLFVVGHMSQLQHRVYVTYHIYWTYMLPTKYKITNYIKLHATYSSLGAPGWETLAADALDALRSCLVVGGVSRWVN